jgi:DDE family transposase
MDQAIAVTRGCGRLDRDARAQERYGLGAVSLWSSSGGAECSQTRRMPSRRSRQTRLVSALAADLPRALKAIRSARAAARERAHSFLEWLTAPSRRLHYSVGVTVAEDTQAAILKVPADSWTPAYDGDGRVRDGAWVADITGMLDLASWPAGMRVIVRKERPHHGAQLRLTDIDGHRFTAFATDARKGQLADLELRHRRRARCEDRIRNAKDTGLRNLPLKGFAQNQLWCEIVSLACELPENQPQPNTSSQHVRHAKD